MTSSLNLFTVRSRLAESQISIRTHILDGNEMLPPGITVAGCVCAIVCMHVWVRVELGGAHTEVFQQLLPPPPPLQSARLIQQPLYPEVRRLDPLTWALWRGVNRRQ